MMAKLALGGNKKCGPGEICDRKDKKGRKRIQGEFLKKTHIELEVFFTKFHDGIEISGPSLNKKKEYYFLNSVVHISHHTLQ